MSNDKKKSKIFIKNKTKIFDENLENDFFEEKKYNIEKKVDIKEEIVIDNSESKNDNFQEDFVEDRVFQNLNKNSLDNNVYNDVDNFDIEKEQYLQNKKEDERIVYNSDIFIYDEENVDFNEKKVIDNDEIIESIVNDNKEIDLFYELEKNTDNKFEEDKKSINGAYDDLFKEDNEYNASNKSYLTDYKDNVLEKTTVIGTINRNVDIENFDDNDDDYGSLDNYNESEEIEHFYSSKNIVDTKNSEVIVGNREKRGKKVNKKRSIFKFFLKISGLFLIACVIIGVYFALTHEYFKIDYIDIKGNSVTSRAIVEEKGGVNIGDNIFLTSKKNIINKLKNINTIEEVEVIKNYPNVLTINIKEKYVSAFINNNSGITTIDNYGKIQELSTNVKDTTGIQFKGVNVNGLKVGEDFTKDKAKKDILLDVMQREYFKDILSIDFTSKDLVVEFKNGLKVQFGEISDFSKKFDIISVLLEKIESEKINAGEIILNVGDDPIIVKK